MQNSTVNVCSSQADLQVLGRFMKRISQGKAPGVKLGEALDKIEPASVGDPKTRQLLRIWRGRSTHKSMLPDVVDILHTSYLTM